MRCWRLVKLDFEKKTFTGEGARIAGGRWNPKGSPVVYVAASLALAALEHLVHADDDLLPADLLSFAVDIPDEVAVEQVQLDHSTAVLCVPSAVIQEEHNFLLNPLHPDFARITWLDPHPFSSDPRLRR